MFVKTEEPQTPKKKEVKEKKQWSERSHGLERVSGKQPKLSIATGGQLTVVPITEVEKKKSQFVYVGLVSEY